MTEIEFLSFLEKILDKIGGDLNISFQEFSAAEYIASKMVDRWTYEVDQLRSVRLCYFNYLPRICEMVETDFIHTQDEMELENHLRTAIEKLQSKMPK